jgi:hypothetical protein
MTRQKAADTPADTPLWDHTTGHPTGQGNETAGHDQRTPTGHPQPGRAPDRTPPSKQGGPGAHNRRCPNCSAAAGEPCTTVTGQAMTLTHRARKPRRR